MAKQNGSQQTIDSNPITGPFFNTTMLNGDLMSRYAEAGQAAFLTAVKMNQELLRFAGERFQADIAAFQTLSQCTNWTELADCQSAFARTATEAYEAELSKLMNMGSDATNAALKPLQETVASGSKS